MKSKKGITLVALIVTIIVMLIIAGVVVVITGVENGSITKAIESKFKSEVSQYLDELELYISEQKVKKQNNENYIKKDEVEAKGEDELKIIIPSFSKKYEDRIYVENGELYYKEGKNKQELQWAMDLGLKINSEKVNVTIKVEGYGQIIVNGEVINENESKTINAIKGENVNLNITELTKTIIQENGENQTLEYKFLGWYEKGHLLNEGPKFEENTTYIAKFATNNTLIYLNNGKVTVNNNNIISRI